MAIGHDASSSYGGTVLISISGVDCAGKTSQLKRLTAHLEAAGRRPVALWFRPGYSDLLDALRAGVRRLRPQAMPHVSADRGAHEQAFRRPRVRRTWLAMALMDSLVHYAARIRALRLAGYTVICDRYIDDALLDLTFKFPELDGWSRAGIQAIRRLSPWPDPAILITLPHEEMVRRMKAKAEPFPDPPEVRTQRYAKYAELADSGHYLVIDGTASVDAIHDTILANL